MNRRIKFIDYNLYEKDKTAINSFKWYFSSKRGIMT